MVSKKRAMLRSQASMIDTKLIIGKAGISKEIFNQALCIINKHELLKGKVLDNISMTPMEAAGEISKAIGAEVVCKIGRKFVLYKKKQDKKKK